MVAVGRVFNGSDVDASLKAVEKIEAKYPPLAGNPYWFRPRLGSLLKAGKLKEAKKLVEAEIARATQYGDELMLLIVSNDISDQEKGNKELMALAVKAAEAMIEVTGDSNPQALIHLAKTYFVSGETVKAKNYARKAVEVAAGESAAVRQSIEKQVKKLEDEEKKLKK